MGCFGSKNKKQDDDEFTDIGGGGGGGHQGGNDDNGMSHISEITITKTINKEDFWIRNRTGERILRQPGEIAGQQFILEDLDNCDVWLFDHCDTVTIDRCTNCRIFVGPTEGSVFVRNCTKTAFVIAAQQFRTRDVEDCDLLLFAYTKPIIESSKNIRFGCWKLGEGKYPHAATHWDNAHMSPYSSYWSQVHDFTPAPGNYSLLPLDKTASDILGEWPEVSGEPSHQDINIVPPTVGPSHPSVSGQDACFVLFYNNKRAEALTFWTQLLEEVPELSIVQTRQMALNDAQSAQLFDGLDLMSKYCKNAKAGEVIAMHFIGPDVTNMVAALATELKYQDDTIFISGDTEDAEEQVNLFFATWVPLY